MTFIRNIALFCVVTTLLACSGLRKNDNKNQETLVKITTSLGEMYIQLSDKTPLHKANFIKLAKESYYDGLLFHRVMKGFMVQGGDPDSRNATASQKLGNGSPGYTIPAEFDTTLIHIKGALAAARQPDRVNPKKASSGSQFYLVQGKPYSLKGLKNLEKGVQRRNPNFKLNQFQIDAYTTVGGTPFLDGGYTVFGQVIKGIEVIDKIAAIPVGDANRPKDDFSMKVELIYVSKKEKEKLLKL